MGQFSEWDESMEMLRVQWEWRSRWDAADECTHGRLPGDKFVVADCACWTDIEPAA